MLIQKQYDKLILQKSRSNWGCNNILIIEVAKKVILDCSKGFVRVLWICSTIYFAIYFALI